MVTPAAAMSAPPQKSPLERIVAVASGCRRARVFAMKALVSPMAAALVPEATATSAPSFSARSLA